MKTQDTLSIYLFTYLNHDPTKPTKLSGAPKVLRKHTHAHPLGQTPTSQLDLPTLIISYFNLNSPEVNFRIPKLKLRSPKYLNLPVTNSHIRGNWMIKESKQSLKGPEIISGRIGLLKICIISWKDGPPDSVRPLLRSRCELGRLTVGPHQPLQGPLSFRDLEESASLESRVFKRFLFQCAVHILSS